MYTNLQVSVDALYCGIIKTAKMFLNSWATHIHFNLVTNLNHNEGLHGKRGTTASASTHVGNSDRWPLRLFHRFIILLMVSDTLKVILYGLFRVPAFILIEGR